MYQDAPYADAFRALLQQVWQAESRVLPGVDSLTRTVARQAFRLMAYKDEYEVARLYTNGRFESLLQAQFAGPLRLRFHLAPPLLSRRDPVTGHLKKRAFGPWVLTAMRWLAGLKSLRGGWLDPFAKTAERRMERKLASLYPAMIESLLPTLTPANHSQVLRLAAIAEDIRGFGHVKDRQIKLALAQWRDTSRNTPAESVVMAFVDQLDQPGAN